MFTVEGVVEWIVNLKALDVPVDILGLSMLCLLIHLWISVHYMVALRVNRFWVIFLLDFAQGYVENWVGHTDLVKTLFSVTRSFIIVKAIDQLLLEERASNNH